MALNKNKIALFSIIAGILMIFTSQAMAAKDYIYATLNNGLQIIDCDSDTVIKTIRFNDFILNATYSPDGKRYYLNSIHSVYAIDTTSNTLIDTYSFSSELSKVSIFGVGVSNDGKKLFLCCSIVKKKQNIPKLNVLPDQLVVYDISAKKMVKNYPISSSFALPIALRNDPDHLFVAGEDIDKINLKTGKKERMMAFLNTEKPEEMRNSLLVWQPGSPDDHGIWVNPYYDAQGLGYFFIDKNTGKMNDLRGKDVWFAYCSILSPDKKHIYSVMDELIKVDRSTGETVKFVHLKTGTNYTLSMTSDGKKIYVGPAGPDISVYDAESLELINVIPLMSDGLSTHRLTKN
jgi:DNA-binding beta-propeller fold protein YncE